MTLTFKTGPGDFFLQSDYSETALNLYRDPISLWGQMLAKLSRYGFRLPEMRLESGTTGGGLGDISLLSYLFNYGVTLRIRLERTEIQCLDIRRVNVQQVYDGVVDIFRAVGSSVKFTTHTLTIGLHGKLEGASARDFISKFIARTPEGLGPFVGSGAIFYYGQQHNRLRAYITCDLSALVTDGLFLRTQAVWDAQKLPYEEFPAAARDHLRDVLARLDLKLEQN